jgi:hypothetical protein
VSANGGLISPEEKNGEGEIHMNRKSGSQTVKAILTDVQFWVPAGVLIAGILLLVFLH